jgi:hypothetical protein
MENAQELYDARQEAAACKVFADKSSAKHS